MADVPDTTRSRPSQNVPVLSVIIPARNEEQSIAACLDSLVAQAASFSALDFLFIASDGLPYEIVVVDDGSTDRTAGIVRSFQAVRLVVADALPPGWTGKCNACATGARYARGSWLLFTDADTVHKPGSLSRSLAEAQSHHAGLLSYSPQQDVSGLAQRILMPLVFAELASTYKPDEVCDPASPVAAANGQFILVSREAYFAVGGHAAVSGDLLEDVALARAVKLSGRTIRFRYGGDIVRTRMYRTFRQMREGWTKNLVLLFPSSGTLALRRVLEFALSVGAAIAVAVLAVSRAHTAAFALGIVSALAFANAYRRIRKAHFGTYSTLISPLGMPLFSYLLLRSRISHKRGNVTWKGRIYSGSAAQAGPAPSVEKQSSGTHNG